MNARQQDKRAHKQRPLRLRVLTQAQLFQDATKLATRLDDEGIGVVRYDSNELAFGANDVPRVSVFDALTTPWV